MPFNDLSNTEINNLINEWIRSDRNRHILKCRLIDGATYVDLATRFNLSERQVKSIVRDGLEAINARL